MLGIADIHQKATDQNIQRAIEPTASHKVNSGLYDLVIPETKRVLCKPLPRLQSSVNNLLLRSSPCREVVAVNGPFSVGRKI